MSATNYPFPKLHFLVDFGGSTVGFSEASGLTQEAAIIEYRDGSSPDFSMIKMPGIKKFNNVTLKRGMTNGNNEFFGWLNTIALNTVERRDVTISLLDEQHNPKVVWKIKNAWPMKVDYGSVDAKSNDVAIESLELAIEGCEIEFL
jgi:phage tail-like protein